MANRCWAAVERVRALRALSDSEARHSAVIDSSLDAVVSMDHQGRIVEWNSAAEKTFGWRRDQAIGRLGVLRKAWAEMLTGSSEPSLAVAAAA